VILSESFEAVTRNGATGPVFSLAVVLVPDAIWLLADPDALAPQGTRATALVAP
jgi:hypothetical protein